MPLLIATPDDYIGATDDIKVRAAIADLAQPEIAFHSRMHKLYDPTPIPVRGGLTLRGPGKQCGRGVQMMTGGCPALFDGTGAAEIAGFQIEGLDLYGANDAAHTCDRLFNGWNAKQCRMINCLAWGFTGDAWFVDGPDSNDCETRSNRINGGTSAAGGSCGIYYNAGNAMLSDGDYVSGYPTLVRSVASGFDIRSPRWERATGGGDACYLDPGGSCKIDGGWVDPTTCGRTVVQRAGAGGAPASAVYGEFGRGIYPTNVKVNDPSRWWWPAYNPT